MGFRGKTGRPSIVHEHRSTPQPNHLAANDPTQRMDPNNGALGDETVDLDALEFVETVPADAPPPDPGGRR